MQSGGEYSESIQSFAYEVKGNSVVIRRCFSRDTKAVIPDQIDGLPVAELAPYAFSAHLDQAELEKEIAAGKIHISRSFLQGSVDNTAELPALCGEILEELIVPATVSRVGRYCFYNCGKLRALSFSGNLRDWGTGVFTGCHQIKKLCVTAGADGATSLKEVLDEVREELCIEYQIRESKTGANVEAQKAVLMIPEYYEEGVENTPARILETHIHGSGMKYRNCFTSRKIDFRQYDLLFPYAQALESPEFVMQMVMGRLRFPYELSEPAREQYEKYVYGHAETFAGYLAELRDMDAIRWTAELLEKEKTGRERFLAELTEQAGRNQFAEALGYAMELQHQNRKENPGRQRRRMEL